MKRLGEIHSHEAFEGVKFLFNSKLLLYFRYKFFEAKFFILDHTENATAGDLPNTSDLLLVSKIYTTE